MVEQLCIKVFVFVTLFVVLSWAEKNQVSMAMKRVRRRAGCGLYNAVVLKPSPNEIEKFICINNYQLVVRDSPSNVTISFRVPDTTTHINCTVSKFRPNPAANADVNITYVTSYAPNKRLNISIIYNLTAIVPQVAFRCQINKNHEKIEGSIEQKNYPTSNVRLPSKIKIKGERSVVTVKCLADGDPYPVFAWEKDGKILKSAKSGSIRLSNRKDIGNYVCKARNSDRFVKSNVMRAYVNGAQETKWFPLSAYVIFLSLLMIFS